MKYKILSESIVYNGFLKIKKAMLAHDCFDKEESIICSREMVDQGDSVAVLLFEKDTDHLLLINQFRYPTINKTNGWLIEIVAGGLEKNENPEMSAIREVKEETGYKIDVLEHITTFYASPGVSSERMHLYYGEVSKKDKIYAGGGLLNENEDIQLCKYAVSTIEDLLQKQHINDAKTIIALQWFLLNKRDTHWQ
ncbi:MULTISPECIES: NUDIX domain-containing protein [Aquimarina]|uniref:NUDIX domain-containing protein n=1 Tax=Aquimarina TaxID=290174 RepID=UPI000CDECE74|nr:MULTISPECIES: NUDIX hydrolase [Aquimarina]